MAKSCRQSRAACSGSRCLGRGVTDHALRVRTACCTDCLGDETAAPTAERGQCFRASP